MMKASLENRAEIVKAQKIVIKVGTSTITYPNGRINLQNINRLSRVLAGLANQGKDVVLVTSGAIGVGIGVLGLEERPQLMKDKQAVAAVGQCELMNVYSRCFAEYSYLIGQILLTKDDLDDPRTRENISNTFQALMEKKIIPIVNENDTVSTQEIFHNGTFGDNDTLSAHVATLIKADLLILLSDIDGLYDCNPKDNPEACRIAFVKKIDQTLIDCAGGSGSKLGTGGMQTKISAMMLATSQGIQGVIAEGSQADTLENILAGVDIGTYFPAYCTIEI